MKQYLLNVYQPEGELPAERLAVVSRDVEAWDERLRASGSWVFTGGLHAAGSSTVVRAGRDGDVLVTDGPYAEGKEHIGGFTIIRAEDLDAALEWARGLSEASTLPVEVRPMRGGD